MPRDPSTTECKILKHVDALNPDFERDKFTRKTKEGKRALARSGRVIASSFRLFGYRFDKKYEPKTRRKLKCTLEIDEMESEIVKKTFGLCANEVFRAHAITKRLISMGELTISDKEINRIRKRGTPGQCHPDTVHGMLTNSTYMGKWSFEKNKIIRKEKPKGRRIAYIFSRDQSEQIVVNVTGLVDPVLSDIENGRTPP